MSPSHGPRRRKRGDPLAWASAFLCLFAAPASAQEAERDDTEDLPEIVVTAERTPTEIEDLGGGIDVVRPDDAPGPKAGVSELLSSVVGVGVQGGDFVGEKATVNTRGIQGMYGVQRTLVLSDGVPINDAYLGDADLRLFSLGMIDRIEVVRGPGSALYGSNALGGVVNVISRRGGETPETELSVFAGGHDTYGGSLGHGGRVGALGYFLSGEMLSTNGYIRNPDGS
ncbi:MAG: TonB-dependent receptor plug domain-containing protein, partial [Planctomycetota bacterium]